jgi:EmrB/QacA subfamily drug resistance transporter
MGSALNVALPIIGRTFGMDAVLLGWVATGYTLAIAISLVPFGRAADIHGRMRVFRIGVAGFLITSLLCGFAASGSMLIAFRALQGIAAAMMFATSSALLSSAYPPQERGRVLGINVASVYMGLSLGPFLGGILTQNFGWRSVFAIGAALGLAAALIALQSKEEWAEARGEPFDWIGTAIYGAAIAAVMYGLSRLPDPLGGALIAAGLAGAAGFVAWEGRTRAPVLNLSLFRGNRAFTLSSLAALINYLATTAVTFLLSLYLQYIKGLTPQATGAILVAQPIMMAIFSPLAGRLSDRLEARIVASAGMALTAAGLLLLVFLGQATPLWYIIAALLLLGVGFGLFSSPNMNAIMGSAEKRLYGVASAIVATMRTLGQMLSLGIALLIFSVVIGRVQITAQVADEFLISIRIAFSVFTILCIIGVFASLARGKVHSAAQLRDEYVRTTARPATISSRCARWWKRYRRYGA